MDSLNKQELEKSKAILNVVKAEAIYLFGSHAYGTSTEDSDYDIYVVIPDNTLRPIDAMRLIGKAIYNEETKPIDIIVGTTSDFHQRKLLPTLERTVFNDGVLLYAEAGHRKRVD